MVFPVIYISLSDERTHLTIDGHLVLLEQFLLTIRAGERGDLPDYPKAITDEQQPRQQEQEVQHV